MDFITYLKPELLIIVAVLVFIGTVIKTASVIPDEFIPVILTISSITLVCAYYRAVTVDAVLQGFIATACAIYGNQTVKQAFKYKNKVNESKPPDVK